MRKTDKTKYGVMKKGRNLLIFVVEDNKLFSRLVCEFLSKESFKKVVPMYSGKECLDRIKAGEKPDIVIQDYHLEDSTGIAVLQAVKKRCKDVEFIFLTANEDLEVAVNSIKFGAYDYIIKSNEVALKKVVYNIEKIARMIELRKKNSFIQKVMYVTVFAFFVLAVLSVLHQVFDAFGLKY